MSTLFASAFGSVHDLVHSTAFDVARNLALFLVVVFWLGLAGWVFRDARRRLDDPLLVGTATLLGLAIPYAGPVIYMLFRTPETLDEVHVRDLELATLEEHLGERALHCPVCFAGVGEDYRLCPVCTTRLKQACAECSAPLEPSWQVCPYCAGSPLSASPTLRRSDLDAALTAEAAAAKGTAREPAPSRPPRS